MAAISADPLTLPRVSADPAADQRTVTSVTTAPRGFEGEGFPVRRAFYGISSADLDPFIHMDQMGEVEYAPGEPKGTPWHPHRGFETFTYLIDGQFIHQDSNGGGGLILDGGTQYMTAGNGILHIETPPAQLVESGGLFHGLQLWINLPRNKKRIDPQYQDLQGADSALLTSADGGAVLRVLAGEIDGHKGPGISHTPLSIAHLTLAPGAQIDIPWSPSFNSIVYALAGSGSVGIEQRPLSAGQTALMQYGTALRITAAQKQESRSPNFELFIIGGEPLREPVVAYGPFVMSTQAEIVEAFEDFQAGRLGVIPADAIQPHRV
ncbi:MAG: pirin-like C-terminal cupin domain-containing protein [Actinomycetota bacterium]|nr:pirin-like C-terminal cupin domain-containing protein [Actinomycetota bacterium]MDP2288093.1 pirin-like C-terminal cupin domain-containing protein [Actinomycetota bacterium]